MNVSTDRLAELTAALATMRVRLARAAEAAGRRSEEIKLLPVTKFFPATDVAILWRLGCRGFGESRSQEAVAKIAEFNTIIDPSPDDRPVNWHMVGRLQRNKAKNVAAWADTVHSVSTPKVIAALSEAVGEALAEGRRSRPVRAFVQISLDGDTERGGVDIGDPAAVDRICALVADADGLELVGLMAVAPLGADPDAAFAALAEERSRVMRDHPGARELSAGMSGDLEAAVRHGSTCVRVGTALMGKRPLTSP
ncbi:MAG TPA: YggS family pyridoxal phosphate-dependent enzyme [Mycobacterium sp.]|uniref:YggS family pyridoxal phosphate-dependent enzyme n=1 Tax=Mycolicibacterium sp. TaxID=2320850 RepID=UPI0025D72BB4|nr:YggS family pyridoxal phosphate-dependent enzyme [Mycolicibacterium sp.]HPX36194.1 YggS family pyridoxal phosphate-dependent enzyme [Mycobacterium sp.]HQC77834.1 YggS family pyridoxal phosphate-dependent enzyme [Mycobacterium sp.]